MDPVVEVTGHGERVSTGRSLPRIRGVLKRRFTDPKLLRSEKGNKGVRIPTLDVGRERWKHYLKSQEENDKVKEV